jgi:hypothetical protein
MKHFSAILCCAVLFWAGNVRACDICGCHIADDMCACPVGSAGALGDSTGNRQRGFFVGDFEQFSHFGTVQLDGHAVGNPAGQFEDSLNSQMFVGYQFNSRVAVQVTVPYLYRSWKRVLDEPGNPIDRGSESGIGDVTLLGKVRVYEQSRGDFDFVCNVIAGVKFPTGSTDRLGEAVTGPDSVIGGHDLTLGSGSYDGIVGGSVYGRWKELFVTAAIQYSIRSTGDFDYRFADDLTWDGGPGVYLCRTHTSVLGLQLNISGESKGADTLQGQPEDDTGITALYLGPEISFQWKRHLTGSIGADLPVLQNNTSLQVVPDYRIHGSLTWRF